MTETFFFKSNFDLKEDSHESKKFKEPKLGFN